MEVVNIFKILGCLRGHKNDNILPVSCYNGGFYSSREKVAILGYDAISYFVDGKPKKGNKHYCYEYSKVMWLFANQENLLLFQRNPLRYLPKNGGYCTFYFELGFLVNSDPRYFKIVDGQLFLFDNKSLQLTWSQNKYS